MEKREESFVMVGFAPDYCHCPIQLFSKEKSYHLMGECHFDRDIFASALS